MSTPSSDNVILGRGSIYFDRIVNGARTGFRHLGNCNSFGLGISTEKLEMRDYTQETAANYKESVVSTDIPVSISGYEFDAPNMALIFAGTESTYTQSSGTVGAGVETLVGASLTSIKGKYFRTTKRSISSVVLKQGATTLVADTDYEVVNATVGLIRLLPSGSTVVDGTAITVEYSYAAVTGSSMPKIQGGTSAEIEGVLWFVSNNTTGPDYDVTIFRASLSPDGEIGLISDEYAQWSLTGKCLSDAAGAYGGSTSSPYYDIIRFDD